MAASSLGDYEQQGWKMLIIFAAVALTQGSHDVGTTKAPDQDCPSRNLRPR